MRRSVRSRGWNDDTTAVRRPGSRYRSRDEAIEAAGGRWRVMRPFERHEPADAVRENGVRALSVGAKDTAFLADLRHLESLDTRGCPTPPTSRRWNGSVRCPSTPDGWGGSTSRSSRTSSGCSSAAVAVAKGSRDALRRPPTRPTDAGRRVSGAQSGALTHLPALERVEIVAGRRLVSLAGAADMAPSMTELFLALCPKLNSIAGIEALAGLEYLHLELCNRVHDISPVAKLPSLLYAYLGLPKGIDSLRPLAGHPTIEHLLVSRVLDGDFTPLTTMPRLRVIAVPPVQGPAGPIPLSTRVQRGRPGHR